MNDKKILGLIGLAKKANKVIVGSELIINTIRKECYLVILAEDASENTKKKVTDKTNYYNVPLAVYGQSNTLANAVGYTKISAVAITDKGFAKSILERIRGGNL